jgi:hypothetical protein
MPYDYNTLRYGDHIPAVENYNYVGSGETYL